MSNELVFPNNQPPPFFYLSNAKAGGQLFLFTDIKPTQSYSSTPHRQPLQGLNIPYSSQGAGQGYTLELTGMISAFYAFFASSVPASAVRTTEPIDRSVYEDVLQIEKIIELYGPSPLFLYHRPLRPVMEVMLTSFAYQPHMSQSNVLGAGEVYPWSIPITMTLVERIDQFVQIS